MKPTAAILESMPSAPTDAPAAEHEVLLTGCGLLDRSERGKLAALIVAERLREVHRISAPLRTDLIGMNSLFATAGRAAPASEDVRLHVAMRSRARDDVETMLWEVEALLCCGPAGGGGFRGAITPSVETKSLLIDRSLVKPSIEVFTA